MKKFSIVRDGKEIELNWHECQSAYLHVERQYDCDDVEYYLKDCSDSSYAYEDFTAEQIEEIAEEMRGLRDEKPSADVNKCCEAAVRIVVAKYNIEHKTTREFSVVVEEMLSQEFKVEAKNREEAIELAKSKYRSGEFVVDLAGGCSIEEAKVCCPNDFGELELWETI